MRNLYILLILWPGFTYAQKIDNTASYRQQDTNNYFRFNYDNDFFGAHDYYYTQGYNLELTSPKLAKNPLSKLLLHLKDSMVLNGLALEHFGFTPTSISSDEILTGDRPFAACIVLKSFTVSVNKEKRERLSAVLSTGMIGPVAFGGGMQKTIHKWIGGLEPHGWQHQISNDVILNYELNHEKLLYSSSIVSVNSNVNLRAGTFNTKAQTGLTMLLGKHSTFNTTRPLNYQFYVYTQPLLNAIAYDASLQGGLFSTSEYTIKARDLTRLHVQNNFGLVVKLHKLYLEYSQTLLGKEFKTGRAHRWGGFRIGFAL